MDSRERVIAAAQRRRPDRPATSLRLTPEADEALRTHLGVSSTQAVLDELDIDLRMVPLPFIGPEEKSTPNIGGEGIDFWGVGYRRIDTPTNTYYEFDHHPLADARTVADVEHFDWPSLDWWDYDAVPGLIDQIHATGHRAIMFFVGGAFETPWYLRGLEQFLVDLHEQPEIVEAICRHVERYYRERGLRVLEKVGDRIDVIGTGGDIGEQHRMLIDPDIWRRQIKPFSGNLIGTFKRMGYYTFYHSDGAIVPVIDDLIEVGLDILDPVQVSADGMEAASLYARFGDRLAFHGAIDEVHVLPRLSADAVATETVRMIDLLGARGGYIVSATHAVQGDTSPENVVAMINAARAYRWA